MKLPLIACCALVAASGAAHAGAERVIAVVENASQDPAAAAEIAAALSTAIERKGYEVVAGPEVDRAVAEAGRPPGADAIPRLLESFKAQRLVVVTVRFLLPSQARDRGPAASAAVGLVAQAFTARGTTWRNALGFIDDEPQPANRKPRPLALRACSRLLWSFPRGPGATLASAAENFEEVTGVPAQARVQVPEYDVLIERLRATRTGPRFRLKSGARK